MSRRYGILKSGRMAATGSIGIHRLRVNKPLVL
jgi:hypothetical protein